MPVRQVVSRIVLGVDRVLFTLHAERMRRDTVRVRNTSTHPLRPHYCSSFLVMTALLALAALPVRSACAFAPSISRKVSFLRARSGLIASSSRLEDHTNSRAVSLFGLCNPRFCLSSSSVNSVDRRAAPVQDFGALPDWRSDPSLTDVYHLPTLSVPTRFVNSVVCDSTIGPYLASNMEELDGIHPRVKLVRDVPKGAADPNGDDGGGKRKLVLLDPSRVVASVVEDEEDIGDSAKLSQEQHDIFKALRQTLPGIPSNALRELACNDVQAGPSFAVSIPQEQQTHSRILQKLLPPEAQPPPAGYEQVGHVLHLNLKPHHEPCGRLIGDVMLEKLKPSVRSVISKVGDVDGPFRTYDMKVLAGEDSTDITLVEHGVTLSFDLSKVYWSTRLSDQRTRSIEEEFQPGHVVADAFCGVGALCVRAAVDKDCTVVANDLNPDAVKYCLSNAAGNGVEDKVMATCGDARDFIAGLGDMSPLPHHLMLNFPLASTDFLSTLRSWPSIEPLDVETSVHVYTFARGDKEERRDAADVAINMVANGLLPYINSNEGQEILNDLGCQVRAREVRDVAPGKVVIWVTFKVTQELLLKMQNT